MRIRNRKLTAWLPATALLATAIATAGGISLTGGAIAASSSNVTVNATVGANMTVAVTNCNAGTITFASVAQSTANTSPNCRIDFGASNHANVNLTMEEAAGSNNVNFFEEGNNHATNFITDKAACALLSAAANEAGVDMTAVSANVAAGAGDCATATHFNGVPDAPAAAPTYCVGTTVTAAAAYNCTFVFGIGQNATGSTPAAYQGVATFAAVQA